MHLENDSEIYFSLQDTTQKRLSLGQPITCMEVRWPAAMRERDENESEANYFSLKDTTIKGLSLGQPIICNYAWKLGGLRRRVREKERVDFEKEKRKKKNCTYVKYKNVKKKC